MRHLNAARSAEMKEDEGWEEIIENKADSNAVMKGMNTVLRRSAAPCVANIPPVLVPPLQAAYPNFRFACFISKAVWMFLQLKLRNQKKSCRQYHYIKKNCLF